MNLAFRAPRPSLMELAERCRRHLERIVRIDSQSDERSDSIPSTPGQERLARLVAAQLRESGAAVDVDAHANVVASIEGSGPAANAAPLALMVHLDTSRGTRAVERLSRVPAWDGKAIPFPANPQLQVSVETYPSVVEFVGQDLLHGPGDAPFGLDDKLGLAQLLTLAELIAEDGQLPRPPLVLVARPDEEIGRMAAVRGIADTLARRGVRLGFTLDGILPFEINVENFNGSGAEVLFPHRPAPRIPGPSGVRKVRVRIGGVNTHGATAHAEGYRAATRFAAQVCARLRRRGLVPDKILPLSFTSDSLRDCDGELELLIGAADAEAACSAWGALSAALVEIVEPHVPRGASWSLSEPLSYDAERQPGSLATLDMLDFVHDWLSERPGFVVAAEESSGRDGYSAPYRATETDQGVRLDVRLRDFDAQTLASRELHLRKRVGERAGVQVVIEPHYRNMRPALAEHPQLLAWPRRAAELVGVPTRAEPIRGGTGVDPFLDRGVAIANLGTGYFAPESEKEFTSLQMMGRHVMWIAALLQIAASAGESPTA